MLAPHIKKKVDKLWDRFWAAGLTNPLVAVEQITYLLFLKRLEDIDRQRVEKGFASLYADNDTCRWSYIRQEKTNPRHLIEVVFPWLRTLENRLQDLKKPSQDNAVLTAMHDTESDYSELLAYDAELKSLHNRMADAYFQLDPNKGQVLSEAIDLIDQLFARAGEGSSAQDIMGDTFEYLLSEMATAGKNGQFRTPRHLIRFMVELVEPKPGERILDPAAGTGGFLFSAQQYLQKSFTDPETLKIEWDGAPHRTKMEKADENQYAAIHNGEYFVGLDNDRTMARIGWMNMILHGIHDPHLVQGDSLSKREGKPELKKLLKPEGYDIVLANPPFTGTVDSDDLEPDSTLFPRAAAKGAKAKQAITNKSELLFCWLMLDALDIGGRCAVIVPEGVLFGNTDAHKALRRELLVEHEVEGVISLPGGVFQPYTGVKTSILIFRKHTRRDQKQKFKGQRPHTQQVWFYEIEADGYTLDAKRNPRPFSDNDLWDALEKFKAWRQGKEIDPKGYFQPSFTTERWRQVAIRDSEDKLTPFGQAFGGDKVLESFAGDVWAMHELFPELPADPKQAESKTCTALKGYSDELAHLIFKSWEESDQIHTEGTIDWESVWKKPIADYNRACREAYSYFELEGSPALPLWKTLAEQLLDGTIDELKKFSVVDYSTNYLYTSHWSLPKQATDNATLSGEIKSLAREVAKLDGFDVILRSIKVDQEKTLDNAKHWIVPVRAWARNDGWQSADGLVHGSHDAEGLVRPEYVQAMAAEGLYDEKGNPKEDLLDPDCIEAHDWNLSAGQYKPFDFTQLKSDKSVGELISELRSAEQAILQGLDKLLAMVEGKE
jgi:type I restriction enzyme M protein